MLKETNLAPANSYYRVTAPFACVIRVGCAESQTYVGASMVLQKVYQRTHAWYGDQIHNLYGGLFLFRAGESCGYEVEITPLDKHPFLKQYMPPYEAWPLDKLAVIAQEEATPFRRHKTLQPIAPETIRTRGYVTSW